MGQIGKYLIFTGGIFILLGVLLVSLPKIPFLGNLPGDIRIQRGNFSFYAPLATALLLSVTLTILLNILLGKKP